MTKRSDQQIALGRCPTRMGRIGRRYIASEVLQYPLDDGWILDARNHPQLPAAASADLDVDREHPLQALGLARIAHRFSD
jgi:hypothetical protein